MTKRSEQYLIIWAMAFGAALLAGTTALNSIATLAALQGDPHPYRTAWMICGTPFVVFPVAGQFLLNFAAGLKSPPQVTGWDGVERRAGVTETVTTTKAAGAADGSAPTVETRTATLTTPPPPPLPTPPDPPKGEKP